MKKVALFTLVVLSLLILGAHFLRTGSLVLPLGSIFLSVLLLIRQPWVARLIQLVLIAGALEWTRTLFVLAQSRLDDGEPFLRLSIILGLVMVMTICSALAFQTSELKRIYRLNSQR